ncbi:hydrolase alpha/beta fold family protein [Beutenbergia cavernae DSM 12333]|uniref:Hydrolase alpha/beta fold family protein n=1 Tax=Beutenbergia cavernae (strain ATCC BAA-8 / DSM 12333 / CCUG 43141 / JCM 11478 / NBRC 16432 / NCIMB 13614 / HKI 0122) TaxID=471853 RepID=C5BYJ2_BEUC1|nr:alpha/beta hydrolase [Beutenbergia cavernae]ACQ78950.1 hydrolase alpha/beta fold family protein [Beutenbergia cavernae DSM 12333]
MTRPRAIRPAPLNRLGDAVATIRDAQHLARFSADSLPDPPPEGRWGSDVLGPDYEARTLPLGEDAEGDVVTTLVRYRPEGRRPVRRPAFAVLYVHGWTDYFLHTELGPMWAGLGGALYAVDLRKYGRSLRVHQTPGYTADLATYDDDLAAAIDAVADDVGALPLVIMAHSTGGLTVPLWAHRHPGRLAALVLVSPWLELQGSQLMRTLSGPVIREIARAQPLRPLPTVDPGFYHRTISADQDGEWPLVEAWRPEHGFPVRYGWLSAILAGHAQVAAGLRIDAPILLLRSARSFIAPVWDEEMRRSDVVLEVDVIAERALRLGPLVTVATIEDALHDVVLSPRPVRDAAYAVVGRWATAYIR